MSKGRGFSPKCPHPHPTCSGHFPLIALQEWTLHCLQSWEQGAVLREAGGSVRKVPLPSFGFEHLPLGQKGLLPVPCLLGSGSMCLMGWGPPFRSPRGLPTSAQVDKPLDYWEGGSYTRGEVRAEMTLLPWFPKGLPSVPQGWVLLPLLITGSRGE